MKFHVRIPFCECEDKNFSKWDGDFIEPLTAFVVVGRGTSGDIISYKRGLQPVK